MWPKRGRLFDVSTGEDIYTLENSGIIITDNYELYDTSKVADTSYEYYFLVSDYNKDIVYDKIKAFVIIHAEKGGKIIFYLYFISLSPTVRFS